MFNDTGIKKKTNHSIIRIMRLSYLLKALEQGIKRPFGYVTSGLGQIPNEKIVSEPHQENPANVQLMKLIFPLRPKMIFKGCLINTS